MTAKNRFDLLRITESEFMELVKLIDSIDANTALRKWDKDTSIKDVIAHRAHWIELFLGWYSDGIAGKSVYFPAKGCKWSRLKHYNTSLRERQSDLGWLSAVAMLNENYHKLTIFIDDLSEKDLYSVPMKGADNDWTLGGWVEAAGPNHFRSASKYIRSRLKSANCSRLSKAVPSAKRTIDLDRNGPLSP